MVIEILPIAIVADAYGACEDRLYDASGEMLERMSPEENPLWAFTLPREALGGCPS